MDRELAVAAKYGVYWGSAWTEDAEGAVVADGLYLHQPERFSELFFSIFDRLRQLNDYCFHQLIASETRLADLMEQRSEAAAKKHGSAEELCYLDDEIPAWEDNVGIVARAVPVVLLSSFTEWGLKRIVREFCGEIPRKSVGSMSDVEWLLDCLRRSPLQVEVGAELTGDVGAFRRVRNDFAHGQWEKLAAQLETLSLRTCFEVVSRLFMRIEEAAWSGPWKADISI